MAATVLYTPEVLGLAVALARYPLTPDLPLHGQARSQSCGSTIAMGLATGQDGTVARVGVSCQACAIGQAAAALFAQAAAGRSSAEIEAARAAIREWLGNAGELPDWPDLSLIAAARDYPARHGAVLLPWNAAMQALGPPPS